MSFKELIELPIDEMLDMLEVLTDSEDSEDKVVFENGEKIIERVGLRR